MCAFAPQSYTGPAGGAVSATGCHFASHKIETIFYTNRLKAQNLRLSFELMELQALNSIHKKSLDGTPDKLTHLVHPVRHHPKLPSEALRGVGLGTVFGQLALVLVADGRLLGDGGTAEGLATHSVRFESTD